MMVAKSSVSTPTLQPPRLPEDFPNTLTFPPTILDLNQYTQTLLVHCTLAEQQIDELTLAVVRWKRGILNQTRVASARLSDVAFDDCDLAGSRWDYARWQRVELVGCRLVNAQLVNASLRDVRFFKCNALSAQFLSTTFKSAQFEQCALQESSFTRANLAGTSFRNCDLRRANFAGAKLVGTDFRGSDLTGIYVDIADLKGAILDPTQVLQLAATLGIIVKHAHEP